MWILRNTAVQCRVVANIEKFIQIEHRGSIYLRQAWRDKNELAMIDKNWCEWTFVEFLEALEKWKINNNNPISNEPKSKSSNTRTIVFSDVFYCFFSFVILERETDAGAYQRFLVSN